MIDLYDKGIAKFPWWQDWRGECVAIVASGPSAKKAGVEQLKDRIHVIAINECFQLCPCDVLYSCDAEWWTIRGKETKNFKGFDVGVKIGFQVNIDGINKIDIMKKGSSYVHELQFHEPGVLGSGSNSAFQSINLAAQFGVTGIALIGVDLRLDNGMHWHGAHRSPMRNPDETRCVNWKKYIDGAAEKLKFIGVDVVNCSEVSKLEAYPKMTIDQMLQRWGL